MSGRSFILTTLFLGKPSEGNLSVLSVHSFAINQQMVFLNQGKRKNGHRNIFMKKSFRKNVPDVGVDLGSACIPSGLATDRATMPSLQICVRCYVYLGKKSLGRFLLGACCLAPKINVAIIKR